MLAAPTAFTKTARQLRAQLREAILHHEAFESPLRSCQLIKCRATCCHDGAVLFEEEAATIRELLENHPKAFAGSAVPAADQPIAARGTALKTATCPAGDHESAADFPAHFPRTRCVFLDRDHKCTLQLLSISQGRHPWFYKPLSCWMHPVLLRPASTPNGRPVLTILGPEEDPISFASCTPCGRPDPTGAPAREVLRAELSTLSTIAQRDFVGELNAPSAD